MADWTKITSRGNVEDRRGMAPIIGGGLGLTGVIVAIVFSLLTGSDPTTILNQLNTTSIPQQQIDTSQFAGQDNYEVFASTVLGSTNDMWKNILSQQHKTFTAPKLVLFRQATQSGCGLETSDVGPNYCPADRTIYLDETFFDELTNKLGAQGGDVAQAYVIAHEAGHHAQTQLGITDQVDRLAQQQPSKAQQLSIDTELQADCFAGLWANSIKDQGVLEPNEIHEAMDAAAAVGDDRVQQKLQGQINPETWTHGSSQQRVAWLDKGYESGNLSACDTFK